ncbi:SusC/RagA family TonB-linked outer membrane protein [Neolewinella persica]|uniref:SusC/RagA family TonB-linked outer membrane protein n=1 Tax=Neolewinella persica TaxID=70998 RepID=UPI0003693F00|nr:TonB-dependent receptor [Neolewinella persica]
MQNLTRHYLLLLLLMASGFAFTQSMVTGRVLGTSEPDGLPGASVILEGTTTGTVTDIDGRYSLSVPDNNAVLLISYTGFASQRIRVNGQTVIDVTLEDDATALEEVVVVGYSTQKRVNLTGAVDVIAAEELTNRPIVSTGEGLQGLVPNLNVTVPSGDPTGNVTFNIRGFESINGGDPLILVDGVPMDLNRINPEDIASISVLKDGAAAAVYGARAAFGVILVETKKGKKGVNVRASTQLSWNKPIFNVNPIENGYEYALLRNQVTELDGSAPVYNDDYLAGLENYWSDPANNAPFALVNGGFQNYAYNNLADGLLNDTSPRQKYDVAISGASDRTNFYTSFGLLNTDGYINGEGNDNFKRYNVLMKGEFKATDWLTIDQQITVNIQDSDKPSQADINTVIRTEPLRPHVIPRIDGYEQFEGQFWNHGLMILPQLANGGRDIFTSTDIWMKTGLKATPVKGLSLNGNFSYNFFNRQFESAELPYQVVDFNLDQDNPVQITGDDIIDTQRDFNTYYVLNLFAEYEKKFGNNDFKFLVGYNQELGRNTFIEADNRTFLSPNVVDISATTGTPQTDGGKSHVALRGAFFRVNYNFKERYLLEVNGRYDGTSRFPEGDRFGFFPSVSAGWRISNEAFMNGTREWLDNLKIRASYGSLGNQLLGNNFYPYIPSLGSGQSNVILNSGFSPFVRPPGLVSPSLTWERVVSKNLGLDLAFFKGKLDMNFDVYTRETLDMLLRRSYPDLLGANAPLENGADLRTQGWELNVNWRNRKSKDFSYSLGFNLSDWTSEITKYENPTGSINEFYVGQQLGEIWGYETAGIFQNEEELNARADQSRLGSAWRVGDIGYTDLNGDGEISQGENTLDNPGDRRIIGNSNPRYSFGINAGVNYKAFSLSIFFQGVGQRDYAPSSANWTWFYPWRSYNGDQSWIDNSWTPDNRDAYFPLQQLGSKNFETQTRYLQNAAYIRLKNVNLAYVLPASISDRIGLGEVRVYVGGQNLWEASPIREPLDPEYIFDNSINYPLFRSYTTGVVINL